MPDIEKVINGLEHCAARHKCNNECPYSNIIQDQNEGMDSCITQLSKDALELLKQQNGLMLALEQSNASNEYLNNSVSELGETINILKDEIKRLEEQQAEIEKLEDEKKRAIIDIDLYIADAESDAKTPQRTGKGYSVGLGHGLLIAKEILQGIRKHG